MSRILFFSLIFFVKISFSQVVQICNLEKIANNYNSNENWHKLLENACAEIKAKKYENALYTLSLALKLDSAESLPKGEPINAYIDMQYRRLKRYIDENKTNGLADNNYSDNGSDKTNKPKIDVTKNQILNSEKSTISSQKINESQKKMEEIRTVQVESIGESNPVSNNPRIKEESKIVEDNKDEVSLSENDKIKL
jgi:hypothetical protein